MHIPQFMYVEKLKPSSTSMIAGEFFTDSSVDGV